jgi:hypothetical protein
MGVLTSEVGYTSATTGRGDHEVHKGHVVALKKIQDILITITSVTNVHKTAYRLLLVTDTLVSALALLTTIADSSSEQ